MTNEEKKALETIKDLKEINQKLDKLIKNQSPKSICTMEIFLFVG